MALKYRRLDANGDYNFGNNFNDFLTDREAVGQAIQTRLKLLLTEWWEDLTDGLPLFQSILGQFGASKAADIILNKRILGTKDVLSIQDFYSTYDGESRAYTYQANVNTIYGTISIEGTL